MSATDQQQQQQDPRDPSGFLKLDEFGRPSHTHGQELPTVVKIVGTAREDMNGLLGFCTSYNRERQRYMVRMASVDPGNSPHATIMALKASNLEAGSRLETYRAQFQQLFTDPRLQQKKKEYYDFCSAKCAPFRLEHVLGGLGIGLLGLWYWLGFTKTLMLISCALLLGTVLFEDVIKQRNPWNVVVKNFPSRCHFVLGKQFPFFRDKISDVVAAGIVGFLVLWTVQSVFFASAPTRTTTTTTPSPFGLSPKPIDKARLEEYYNLGFQDGIDGNEKGHSFASAMERLLLSSVEDDEPQDLSYYASEIPYTETSQPPPLQLPPTTRRSFVQRLFSMRTAMSIFYLYRMIMQIGIEPSTGIFSFAQLAANIQHRMPPWQKGMLAFSCYNLFSNLFL